MVIKFGLIKTDVKIRFDLQIMRIWIKVHKVCVFQWNIGASKIRYNFRYRKRELITKQELFLLRFFTNLMHFIETTRRVPRWLRVNSTIFFFNIFCLYFFVYFLLFFGSIYSLSARKLIYTFFFKLRLGIKFDINFQSIYSKWWNNCWWTEFALIERRPTCRSSDQSNGVRMSDLEQHVIGKSVWFFFNLPTPSIPNAHTPRRVIENYHHAVGYIFTFLWIINFLFLLFLLGVCCTFFNN